MSEQIDFKKLENDIRNVIELRHDKGYYGSHGLHAIYRQAHDIIDKYNKGKINIPADNARLFEKYIYEMTRSHHKILDRQGFKAMIKLRDEHGISKSYIGSNGKLPKKIKKQQTTTGGKAHRIFRKAKMWLLAGTVAAAGLWGVKAFKSQPKTQESVATEITLSANTMKQSQDSIRIISLAEAKQQESKIAPIAANTEKTFSKNDSIWKNYYDSALKIHLGETKRNKLYENIENLIKNQNITPEANFSIYRYAHSVTMWNLLKPYSAENKFIKEVMAGKKLSPEENRRFNSLISQAGEKGKGLSGSGKNSNYDRSNENIQLQHKQAIRAINQYFKNQSR